MTVTDKFWGGFLLILVIPATLIAFPAIEVVVVLGIVLLLFGVRMLSKKRRRCNACGHVFHLSIPRVILIARRKLHCPRCDSHLRKTSSI